MTTDPTYDKKEIEENLNWHIAWVLSEILNDNAPIGWSKYVPASELLSRFFKIEPKPQRKGPE